MNTAARLPAPAPALANVLELGRGALALHKFLLTIAADCRRLTIEPAGDFIRVGVTVPGLQQVAVTPALAFARQDQRGLAALEAFVGDVNPARLMAVHDEPEVAIAQRLLPFFQPDLLIWPEARALPAGFERPAPLAHAGRFGLAGHVLANRPGYAGLREALLVRADAARRTALSQRTRITGVQHCAMVEGFWPTERNKFAAWAWTGPQRLATLLLPPAPPGPLRLTLFLYATKIALAPEQLRIFIDGRPVPARCYPQECKIEADILNEPSERNNMVLRLQQSELGASDDGSRRIGVALHKVKSELLA